MEVVAPDSYSLADVAMVMNEILNDDISVVHDWDFHLEPAVFRFPQALVTAPEGYEGCPLTVACTQYQKTDRWITGLLESITSDMTKVDLPIDFNKSSAFHVNDAIRRAANDANRRAVNDANRRAVNTKLREMTNLKSLTISLCHEDELDEETRTIICNLITTGNLESLGIVHTKLTGPSLRFFEPIFEAIEATGDGSTLQKFGLRVSNDSYEEPFQNRMIDILKRNMALVDVQVGTRFKYYWLRLFPRDVRSRKEETIDYYADMNRFGRGVLRNSTSPLLELVDNLSRVTREETSLIARDLGFVAAPVLYGLLREAPGKWSECQKDLVGNGDSLP